MAENLVCNLCDRPGTYADSREIGTVRSNVRKHRHESFTLWRCNSCASLHAKEHVDLDYYYRDYYYQNVKTDVFWRRVYRNRVRQLRRAGWNEAKSMLDFGCGAGAFVQYVRKTGAACDGYDPYGEAWSNPAPRDRQYDVVTAYDVIEHLDDPREFIVRLGRLVRPGGLLLFTTPDAAELSPAESWFPELHAPYHRRILSEQAFRRLGESLGLQVRLVEHLYHLDSLLPLFNSRFVYDYVRACGGVVDVMLEPPRIGTFLKTPSLWFAALFGSFYPYRASMTVCFTTPERTAS